MKTPDLPDDDPRQKAWTKWMKSGDPSFPVSGESYRRYSAREGFLAGWEAGIEDMVKGVEDAAAPLKLETFDDLGDVRKRLDALEAVAHEPAAIPVGNIQARLNALEVARAMEGGAEDQADEDMTALVERVEWLRKWVDTSVSDLLSRMLRVEERLEEGTLNVSRAVVRQLQAEAMDEAIDGIVRALRKWADSDDARWLLERAACDLPASDPDHNRWHREYNAYIGDATQEAERE